jgi:hypothetical protein
MIEQLEKYAKHLNANEEVFLWLRTAGKKALSGGKIDASKMEHILDFLVSGAAPSRLQKMSVIDAKRKATEWSESQQKKGKNLKDSSDDIELIHDFFDGTKIVRLKTKQALQREGFLMGHCVGGYSIQDDQQIYSYRDEKNMPHATFEVKKSNNEIVQIKGKGNGAIHPKYIHPILAFLKTIGMNIRPSDMVNLGYYHLHSSQIDFLRKYENAYKQIVMINGEAYAF